MSPQQYFLNDVAALPGGGFLATQMFDTSSPVWGGIRTALGLHKGQVYRWRASGGFTPIPSTQHKFPNGIVVDAEGRHFFVNYGAPGAVRKYRISDGQEVASVDVASPDNLSWADNGQLLAVSQRFSLWELLSDRPLAFAIVAMDPETMVAREIFTSGQVPVIAATVAVEAGEYFYIGSYRGDRIVKVHRDRLH